jgi:signal transduction histidine kinase
MENFVLSLKNGLNKIRQNPQLLFSVFVAIVILGSFIFVANRFVIIAQDAQDRLMNIRMGFFLDSFVEFAPDEMQSDAGWENLGNKVLSMLSGNTTFRELRVVEYNEAGEPIVRISQSRNLVGQIDAENELLYDIVKFDENESFTIEKIEGGERYFSTIRSILDEEGNVIGAAIIDQSLTEADLRISEEINQSILVFIVVVFLIMLLFFRHAKIIDYTALYRKLKEVDQLKDDFVSMASHELRTPLTVIRGYAEELRESKELPEDLMVSAERIDIAAKQLDSLVGDMLDVSRIEQGRMKLEMSVVNPVEMLADAVSNFETVAKNKGLNLNLKHTLSGEKIQIDPDKFRQVMINLIGNAIKYTPKGDVTVTAKAENGKVMFRVSDSGIGISAEDQKKLFEKFYRVKNKDTAEIRGTGLGLWITKQIVELMKGKIGVESIRGVGTHFIVEFPVVNQ